MKRDSLYKVVTYAGDLNRYLNKYKDHESNELEGYIGTHQNIYYRGGTAGIDVNEEPMSIDDQRWLDACIAADKFVHIERSTPYIPISVPSPEPLTQEEALQIAKAKYPLGTVFIDAHEKKTCKITENWNGHGSATYHTGFMSGDPYILVWTDKGFRYILLCNEWAEIVDQKEKPMIIEPAKAVVGQYLEALINNPEGGTRVKRGHFGRIKYIRENGAGGLVDFPEFRGYSFNFLPDRYRLMPVGWAPVDGKRETPKLKIAEGVYGDFGDPLKASMMAGGQYVAAVDRVTSGGVAQLAMADIEFKLPKFPPYFLHSGNILENKLEKNATIPSLDSYIQQPIIIKKSHKSKTLKIV